jgi:hypothetical protein
MNVDHNLQQVKKFNLHRSLCLSFENVQLPDDFLNVSLASDMIDTLYDVHAFSLYLKSTRDAHKFPFFLFPSRALLSL